MNIQPDDTLLAIYRLTNAQDKADAIDKLPDDATIPLEDVLVMTHKAVLLEVTDVRLGGYAAKSIPIMSDEPTVEYVSTDGVLTPRSSELALEDVEEQPFIINLGKPLSEGSLTHEMLYAPGTNARYYGKNVTVANAYGQACIFDELPGVWVSKELWRVIDTHLGLEALIDGVNTLDLCVPMPKAVSDVMGKLEDSVGWRELWSLYHNLQDLTASALLDDFEYAHKHADLPRDGKIEARIVAYHLTHLAGALTSLAEEIPHVVSVLSEGVKALTDEYGSPVDA